MILLHIACVDNRLAGVNAAVKSLVEAQNGIAEVALLNLANCNVGNITNEFLLNDWKDVESLPSPFCKPDLVIFHELYRRQFLYLYPRLLKTGVPYVIIPHGGLTKKAQSVKWIKKAVANIFLFNRFINHATQIQFLSENEKNNSRSVRCSFVAPNGIKQNHLRRSPIGEIKKFIYVGRLDYYIKGIDLMLDAIKICADLLRENQCTVWLYGPIENGSDIQIKRKIGLLGLDGLVCFGGPVEGDGKSNLLLTSDCFIQTSRSEGMSLGILEALSCGLPCVLTKGTSMTEIVSRYNAGWTCENNAESIARGIVEAVNSQDANNRSQRAVQLIEENYLMDNITNKVMSTYRRIANNNLE